MNKYSILFLLFFITIFTGCGDKISALNHFEDSPKSASLIQYTKKRDILYKNEQKALFFGTYLNNVYEEYEENELYNFVIGLHIVNSDDHNLIENKYQVTLNNKETENITKLDNDSDLVKNISLKNAWANYYLVQFKKEKKTSKLNLKLTHPTFGQAQLTFDK